MKPRAFTPEQEALIVAAYRADPRHGRIAQLAREYRVAFGTIRNAIDRAPDAGISDSRGTSHRRAG